MTVRGGDSAALLRALADGRVGEIWLTGGVSVPAQTRPLHVDRDLVLGGLVAKTPLHFEAGGIASSATDDDDDDEGPSFLVVMRGFVAMVNLRIYGMAEFRGLEARDERVI